MIITEFLKNSVRVFAEFSPERILELVNGSDKRSFEAGEVIMHQGAEAAHFGVVLSGTVSASVTGDGAVTRSLGVLKAGETFGEMALMTGDAAGADFIAES